MPFYPGPGLGEPCIPIDPFNLTWKAREFGISTRFIELAYKANVDNDRESSGYVLMDKLAAKGASVAYYDPFIPVIRPSREHGLECSARTIQA